MEIKLEKKNFVFLGVIALSVILWAFFLDASGMMLKEILNLGNLSNIISKLKSMNFILFLALFPLTVALTVIHCKTEENKMNSFITAGVGVLIGLILSAILFSNLQEFLLLGVFYLTGILLTVEMVYTKISELKKYVSLRLLGTGIHKTATITAIGLFLLVAMTVYNEQEIYSKQIDNQLIQIAGGDKLMEDVTEQAADSIIVSQKELIKQIKVLPSFQALETSPDPNAVQFYSETIALEEYLNSPEYKNIIKTEVEKKSSISGEQFEGILDSVKNQMPMYGIITDFLWLIMAFAFFSIFLLISNTLFYALTVVYGLIIEQIFSAVNK